MSNHLQEGKISWQSPSNIAIVKYWGKYGTQQPRNCSLSLTLDKAHTKTILHYTPKENNQAEISLRFLFEGVENPAFGLKSKHFLQKIVGDMPFLHDYDFIIDTRNTFPHSSGIASSASGMSALAAAICHLEQLHNSGTWHDDDNWRRRVSHYARLGSGSACRSVYPIAASWGLHAEIEGSSDEFATPMQDQVHDVFKSYHDDILIVSKSEKSVSSSAGHDLMNGNLFAPARYRQANENIKSLLIAMEQGDLHAFGSIAEEEALTLHALMMCSRPSYMLIEPNTVAMIQRIQSYRKDTGLPVYFTLDAGPNIHLLYPDEISNQLQPWIASDLLPLCQDGKIISDTVGQGTSKLS